MILPCRPPSRPSWKRRDSAGPQERLDAEITVHAATDRYAPVIHALMCLCGISALTTFGLAVEIGDWTRFTGSTIGTYLGLVPSEHSSGASRSQGGRSHRQGNPALHQTLHCTQRLIGNDESSLTDIEVSTEPTLHPKGQSPASRVTNLAHRWREFLGSWRFRGGCSRAMKPVPTVPAGWQTTQRSRRRTRYPQDTYK
jgi:transposase